MKTLVIIPCYNEEENLDRVVERLHAAAPDVDYLIVNDCSTDGSAAVQSPRLQLHFSARKPWHRRRRTERLLIRPGARL